MLLAVFLLCSQISSISVIYCQDKCYSDNSNDFRSIYGIGDTISISDQLIESDICYGNYSENTYKLADNNYELSGGLPKITALRLNAAW